MKKNFRKALSLLTVTAMAASLAACGGSTPAPETTAAAAETEAAAEESKAEDAPEAEAPAEAAGDEGKVLNIWCWNDEFQSRFNDYYPEVKEVSADKSTTSDYAVCEGPQPYYWGGTWICAATGTDNPATVKDVMLKLTCDDEVMKEIVTKDNDFVNNKPVMEAMAKDESYGDAVLGGQNALAMFCEGADKIDLSNLSNYDQGCNEEFQNAMKNYFEGGMSYEEALNLFYKAVVEKYPELSY